MSIIVLTRRLTPPEYREVVIWLQTTRNCWHAFRTKPSVFVAPGLNPPLTYFIPPVPVLTLTLAPLLRFAQVERVALARGLSTDQVRSLITQNTEDRFLGIFGEPGINVLKRELSLG
ncbi:hypothetical protein APPUASWS_026995 [Arthrospira platensis str. Paraca]|nr:hypothetical protein APPUASWS_026995 [Arthrospira platensis str. Paraca]